MFGKDNQLYYPLGVVLSKVFIDNFDVSSLLDVMAVVEWVVIYSGEMYAQLCRSPFLEGRWNFEWFGAGSPGLFAARFLFE